MRFEFFNRSFDIFTNNLQREKFLNFIFAYLTKPAVLVITVVTVVFFIAIFVAKLFKNYDRTNKMVKLLPVWYFLVILSFSFLNRNTGNREIRLYFDYWFASDKSFHESNVILDILNTLYYMPFGLFIYRYISTTKKFIVSLLMGLFTSVLMETLQYIFARGVSAINDVVFNVIGTTIGVLLCMVYLRKKDKNNQIKQLHRSTKE